MWGRGWVARIASTGQGEVGDVWGCLARSDVVPEALCTGEPKRAFSGEQSYCRGEEKRGTQTTPRRAKSTGLTPQPPRRVRTGCSLAAVVVLSAIILRHQESINELMLVGKNTFEASNFGPQIKEFDYARTDLYRAIFTNGNLSGLLKQTIESFDPDIYNDDAYFFVSRLKWPQIAIIKAIFTADAEEEFNQAMEKALLLHKEYYSHEDHNVDYQGAISLPLTALAALAYDHKKYKVKVENEYIPSWLVERD